MTSKPTDDEELDDFDEEDEEEPVAIESSVYERNWAIVAHVGGLFGSFLVPMLLWLFQREYSPLMERHGREALNFHLTMLIGLIAAGLLIPLVVGLFALIALIIYEVVVVVRAGIAAGRGQTYRYPLTIRFIR